MKMVENGIKTQTQVPILKYLTFAIDSKFLGRDVWPSINQSKTSCYVNKLKNRDGNSNAKTKKKNERD